jgi:hypothetical protein
MIPLNHGVVKVSSCELLVYQLRGSFDLEGH